MKVVVEVLDSHGRVRARERLTLDPANLRFTVGRGVAADVIVDDPHAAALHAAVDITPAGGVLVSDLDSLNGISVGARRLRGAQARALPVADGCFGIGRTSLRVRTAAESLAPELPEDDGAWGGARTAPWLALFGALFFLLFAVYVTWLGAPQDAGAAIATAMISALVVASIWIAAWGFVTRVMLGEWRWLRHAAIFFCTFAALALIDWVLDVLWFALALPSWPLGGVILLVAFAACALYLHLRGASIISARRAASIALLLPLVIGGSSYLVMAHNQSRNVNHIDTETQLFPPDWRLRGGGSLDSYFADAARLREETDEKRRSMPSEDGEAGETGEAD